MPEWKGVFKNIKEYKKSLSAAIPPIVTKMAFYGLNFSKKRFLGYLMKYFSHIMSVSGPRKYADPF